MLSIGKMAPGQGQYYLEQVAQGTEDYYLHAGEAPGRWGGSGSGSLDLQGEVQAEDFRAVLAGTDPRDGQYLGRKWQANKVPGFDLTFSAPKSVSLLFALGDREAASSFSRAHARAVDAALGHLERVASHGRRGRGGTVSIPTSGFVAAAFRHRSSRAGDPQLHTHCIVANKVLGADGRWSSLDGAELYRHARSTGTLYQAHLRYELRELGLRWDLADNGTAEIKGIPAPLLRGFSQRRVEVEQRMADLGTSTARGAQIAALDTRRAKDYGVTGQTLMDTWLERAAAAGFGTPEFDRLLEAGRSARGRIEDPVEQEQVRLACDRLLDCRGLTERASTFDQRDVLRGLAARLESGAAVDTVEQASEKLVLTAGDLVPVGRPEPRPGVDGPPLHEAFGVSTQRYTTAELLAVERALVESALQRERGIFGLASTTNVNVALASQTPKLSDEQEAMVRRLCHDGSGVAVVNALAGSGKTTAMGAATRAWTDSGHQVLGACLSAKAAALLQAETHMPTSTVARLLADIRSERFGGFRDRTVVVIDEAGQVGTRALAEIHSAVAAADGKLVLVGDTGQLPEIEAGGAFRGLVDRLDVIELTTNRRQIDLADRERLDELRSGNVRAAVRSYDEAGRIARGVGVDETLGRLVGDWSDVYHSLDRDAGARRGIVMLGMTNNEVNELNGRARELLRQAGHLHGPELRAGERIFQAGDRVVTRRNDYVLGVHNGDLWRVVAVDGFELELVHEASNGGVAPERTARLPEAYLLAGHAQHAYALTVAVSQGSTYEQSFVLGSEATYREAGYVAASRATAVTRFYVAEDEARVECGAYRLDGTVDGVRELARNLERSRAEPLALDV